MAIDYRSKTDKWVKCISTSGTIRAVAIDATEVANLLAKRHQLSEAGTIALSECMIAGLILSSYCKSGEKINLNIQGSGWCQQAIVDANAEAEVRGYLIERPQEKVTLGRGVGPWGIGLLSVLRTRHEDAQPYIGTVPLVTGRLAKDLTFYWLQSEQVQSAVGIEVITDEAGAVTHAEGFLIQALPGATDADIQIIEEHLKKLHQFDSTSVIRSTPVHLLSYLLENQSFTLLEETPLTLKCPCSLDRVSRSLMLIGKEELSSMLKDGKDYEINCDFCSEVYTYTPKMIKNLILQAERP
jgi:molecular chaperone Hsp33